jgi:hypothetical protein
MIKQCKKAISTVLSILILPAFIGNLQGSSVQAENEAFNTTILYGDANLDGGITPNDALCITNYLLGKNFATPAQFTAMDYNRDKVVDQYDAQKIMIDALYGYSYNYTNSFYTVPDNSARTYYKHICNTGTSSTYSSYQISAATNPISNSLSVADESLLISNDRTIDLPDNENTCCVKVIAKDYTNATIEYRASGFIMKNGVIATAAHALYNYSNGFMKSAKVYFCNEDCTSLLAEVSAESIHIPQGYITDTTPVNYDYGLIYYDPEDVIYYDDYYSITNDKVKIGFMSNEFAYTGTNVTISGFTWDQNHSYRRYYSTGPIQSMDNLPDEKNYRFHLWAYGNGGQSGGMTYYKPTSDYKSTLGILTGGVGIDSYGMKLNTTLLRFYLQNTNL